MPDFSLVTCISDPTVYETILLNSAYTARNQYDYDVEFIPIINTSHQHSASEAFNIAIEVARSDILIFAHQDVQILGTDWFTRLNSIISSLPADWAVLSAAGIAIQYQSDDIGKWGGALNCDTVAVGQVWNSSDILDQSPYWNGMKNTQEIHAADECIIILNRRHNFRFDPMFFGFHFYGIDICLQARAAGYKIYGGELPIIHHGKYSSSLIGDNKYWVLLRYLHNKWKSTFPQLFTTHMHWVGDDITSYIATSLESGGKVFKVRAIGISKVRTTNDQNWNVT